jgi:hypothetical protein
MKTVFTDEYVFLCKTRNGVGSSLCEAKHKVLNKGEDYKYDSINMVWIGPRPSQLAQQKNITGISNT